METRIGTCSVCQEEDYLDYTATIDGKRYCQQCYTDHMDALETACLQPQKGR